jgi:hypothetical protein
MMVMSPQVSWLFFKLQSKSGGGLKTGWRDDSISPATSESVETLLAFAGSPLKWAARAGLVSSLGGLFTSDGENYHKMQTGAKLAAALVKLVYNTLFKSHNARTMNE